MSNNSQPFSITYSSNIPDLLLKLKCSLAISTYQAGKVIFIFAANHRKLVQLPKHFKKPMGIALSGEKMVIGTIDQVIMFANSPKLTTNYPVNPGLYDALFLPRAVYFCSRVDLHDLNWGKKGLWAVNTKFSCLCTIDDNYSFNPQWQPPFITDLMPEDRCHLNGMAMINDKPAYVTALSTTNTHEGWRKNITESGVLMHVPSGKIILDGLPMPHSPRHYNGKLYLLLSATGELMCYDIKNKTYTTIQLPGFVRGMAEYGNYLFIGLSKIRKKSKTFGKLPIVAKAKYSGIIVVYKPTNAIIGEIRYENSVEEIYDVLVLPNIRRPCLVTPDDDVHEKSISAPNLNFWKKERMKTKAK